MIESKNDVVAIIPARGGSKGVPGKNLRQLGGVPLIGRAIQTALRCAPIDSVYVSSEHEEILNVSVSYGAHPLVRPTELSGDNASSEAALLHGLGQLKLQGVNPKILVFIQCTSPFLSAEHLDALVVAVAKPGIAAALTVSPDHGFLWKRDASGEGAGVNHDPMAPRQLRQEMEPQFRENGAAYAMRVADFIRVGRRFCGPVALVEMSTPAIEIDDPADLILCEAWLNWSTGQGTSL